MPVQPAAVWLPYCDACALCRLQSFLKWWINSSIRRTPGRSPGRPKRELQRSPFYFTISAGMIPCLISMFFVAMARATSSISMPASWGVGSSLGGASPHYRLAEPGLSYGQARDDRTMVERVQDHLAVSCWSCHCGALFHIEQIGASL